jgi:hypothetical protein
MQTVLLSDHPTAMLRAAQRRREAAGQDLRLAHAEAHAAHRAQAARARQARDRARGTAA